MVLVSTCSTTINDLYRQVDIVLLGATGSDGAPRRGFVIDIGTALLSTVHRLLPSLQLPAEDPFLKGRGPNLETGSATASGPNDRDLAEAALTGTDTVKIPLFNCGCSGLAYCKG